MVASLRVVLAIPLLLLGGGVLAADRPGADPDGWANLPRLRARGPITDAERSWWAFRPVTRPQPPNPTTWDHNPIDTWVRTALVGAGRAPTAEAEPRVLVRRLTFDLTGLPPTPGEVSAFESDCRLRGRRPAVATLTERLLASPAYGERWARHWLDLVRYAESDGYRVDDGRPDAWRYRDWVVESFNRDLPYDEFVRAQLAGDELWPDDPMRARVATAYLRHGIYEYNNRDVRGQWQTLLNDLTDVTADVFLGMGVQCARCHDHKYDPILQRDYYRLQAFFAPLLPRDDLSVATAAEEARHAAAMAAWQERARPVLAAIEEIEAPVRVRAEHDARAKFTEDIQGLLVRPPAERSPFEHQIAELAHRQVTYEWGRLGTHMKPPEKAALSPLREKLKELERDRPAPLPRAYTATDVGPVAPPVRMPRGGDVEVEPGFLSVLDPGPAVIDCRGLPANTTGRRATLARWLTDPRNPLTARVIVNRVWQQHFGTGLVASGNDFGVLGERPSHPEVLDWLATELVGHGWSLKHLHRLIVTSATYAQASAHPRPDGSAPDARRLEGFPLRRLDAEQLRDALLAVGGGLDPAARGPSVNGDRPRRSVYTRVLRNTRDPVLGAFDTPEQFCSNARRSTTTTPTQALLMMNGGFVEQRARALAIRVEEEAGPVAADRVKLVFRRAFGRSPDRQELADAQAFLVRQEAMARDQAGPGSCAYRPDRAALTDLCHAVLNSNEFLYLD